MSEQERQVDLRQVNLQLTALDDAHRLGRVPRGEYRRHRRRLLGSLCDDRCETARDTVRRPASASQRARPAARERAAPRSRLRAISFGVLGGALCAGLALIYWLVLHTM